MTTSQRRNDQIEVVSEKESHFFMVENEIMTEYRPIIGATGYDLYGFYSQMANRKKNNSLYPSMQLISAHLGYARSTLSEYNWLLEWCGLLRIEAGAVGEKNIYYLLPVKPITPELLAKLTQVLQPDDKDCKEWARFKANRLEAVKNWQPLSAHFKAKPAAPKEPAAPAPVPTPPPAVDLPRQAELVAYMTETFQDGKKPLSEAAAMKMIEQYGLEAVKRQISWLERRDSDNPLRTLRAALKDDWCEPKPIGQAKAEPFTPADRSAMALDVTRMNEAHEPAAPAPESPPPDPLWQEVKERLQMQMTQATFDSCVRSTELVSMEGNQWLIQCDSTSAQDWLENRLNGTLTRTANSVAGQEVTLQFTVRE